MIDDIVSVPWSRCASSWCVQLSSDRITDDAQLHGLSSAEAVQPISSLSLVSSGYSSSEQSRWSSHADVRISPVLCSLQFSADQYIL